MKKVLVAYTNYDYLKYVKAWVRGARDVGKWDDDIVIIIPLEDKVKVQETMETSGLGGLDIKLFYAKPFTKDFYIHYYKLFVFDDYFKQWDWIFHVDLDVIFNGAIPPNPSELLGSSLMKDMVQELKSKYENQDVMSFIKENILINSDYLVF